MWPLIKRFVFPPYCLGCNVLLKGNNSAFCPFCADELALIDPLTRCVYCFEEEQNIVCSACQKLERRSLKMASAFDYEGPIRPFVHRFKYGNMPYLAKLGALYLLAQIDQLDLPHIDYLVAIPMSRSRQWFRGYNQSVLLASALSKFMGTPTLPALTRKFWSPSQASQDREGRRQLTPDAFQLKKPQSIEGKTLLLIDDVLTTGSTLRAAAERLYEGAPKAIYGLTLVRTL